MQTNIIWQKKRISAVWYITLGQVDPTNIRLTLRNQAVRTEAVKDE